MLTKPALLALAAATLASAKCSPAKQSDYPYFQYAVGLYPATDCDHSTNPPGRVWADTFYGSHKCGPCTVPGPTYSGHIESFMYTAFAGQKEYLVMFSDTQCKKKIETFYGTQGMDATNTALRNTKAFQVCLP